MDDEEKKAEEADEPLDDKEAQLLKELKMGQSTHAQQQPDTVSARFAPSAMPDKLCVSVCLFVCVCRCFALRRL